MTTPTEPRDALSPSATLGECDITHLSAEQYAAELQTLMRVYRDILPKHPTEPRDALMVTQAKLLPCPKCSHGKLRPKLRCDECATVFSTAPTPDQAEKRTMCIDLTEREQEALERLMAEQELSDVQVFRQALKGYQLDHERRKAGETVTWSGDAQRARDFARPPTDQADTVARLVEQAYREGYRDSRLHGGTREEDRNWSDSRARQALATLTPEKSDV